MKDIKSNVKGCVAKDVDLYSLLKNLQKAYIYLYIYMYIAIYTKGT